METVVAVTAVAGVAVGAAVSALVSVIIARRADRRIVEQRLERIEHMLTALDQAWYWTPEWQEGEIRTDTDLTEGRGTTYHSAEEFLAALDSMPSADEPSTAA
ncbi:MAG: hypothetical protein JO100_00450 [Pseudonocardia sp.]|nr:hypothetical protein [Pseudonocardia sp.]